MTVGTMVELGLAKMAWYQPLVCYECLSFTPIIHTTCTGWSYVSTKAAQVQGAGTTMVVDPGMEPKQRWVSGGGGGRGAEAEAGGDAVSSVEAGNNRDLASLRKAQRARGERLSGSGGSPDPRGRPPSEPEVAVQKSPNCSTYHTSYNLRDENPDLYAE